MLFFGLPRSYESLVLPSIVENVLIPNLEYNCDVFAHAPRLTREAPGRSGKGGIIDPTAIYKLEERVLELYRNSTFTPPTVKIITDSEDDFFHNTMPLSISTRRPFPTLPTSYYIIHGRLLPMYIQRLWKIWFDNGTRYNPSGT